MAQGEKGEFLPDHLMDELRAQICFVDRDPYAGKRIYFENAGGSLTLLSCCELADKANRLPDAHKRPSPAARYLREIVEKGMEDARIYFGANSGVVCSNQTASRCIANITEAIAMHVAGDNIVTTDLEHPATYDSAKYYAECTGKELRSAKINKKTGDININDLLSKIDKNTTLLSFIHSSNITGVINDAKRIVTEARRINPDIFILLDATQHLPHGVVDVEELQVDACTFTPYKLLGKRGIGVGWLSERASRLPHLRVLESSPTNWEYGSCEPAAWGTLSLVLDYLCWLGSKFTREASRRKKYLAGMHAIELHERAIMNMIINGTERLPGIKEINGVNVHFVHDLAQRDCIIPITFKNISTSTAVNMYMEKGIIVFERERGNPMSRRVLDGIGIPELVRVSPMHYNTREEVEIFLKATVEIAKS